MPGYDLQKCILGAVATNCYFLKNEETGGLIIVDPADLPQRIFQKVEEMGGKPEGIFLTHGHYDHILAAEDVRKKYGVPLYACRQEEALLKDSVSNLSAYGSRGCALEADVWLGDGQIFELAGFSVEMLHTPGHTKGSCCYYLKEEGILFSGDTLFYGSVGRTDFPGGSTAEIVRSLHRLVDQLPEETQVFPGHDASTTIGYEKRYNPFV